MSLICFAPTFISRTTMLSHYFVSGGIISCKMTGDVRYPSQRGDDESFMDTYLKMESIENECSSSTKQATNDTTTTIEEQHPTLSSISSSDDDDSSSSTNDLTTVIVDESQSSSLDFFQGSEQQFETTVDEFIRDLQDTYPQEETTIYDNYDDDDDDDDGLKEELAALNESSSIPLIPFEQQEKTLDDEDLSSPQSSSLDFDYYQKIEMEFEIAVDEYVQDLRMMSQEETTTTTTTTSLSSDDDHDDDDDDGLKEELEALESLVPPLFTTTGLDDVDEMPFFFKDNDFDFDDDQEIDNNTSSSFSNKDLLLPSFQSHHLKPDDCDVLMPLYHSDHHYCAKKIMQVLFDHHRLIMFIMGLQQVHHCLLALIVLWSNMNRAVMIAS